MERRSQPRALRKSVRYPTYQLSATADSTKESPERQLVICALSVLEWIRTKLQEFEIPDEFQTPPPENYQAVRLEDLKSAHINAGYSVETVCIPEEKVWAFRLVEPDLSVRWDRETAREVSTAVPGRLFETNLAFRVVGATLHCGINVVVSEPENTTELCRVLRPAVVERLAVNPLVGLFSRRPLEKRLWELNSREAMKNLRNNIQTGNLPAIIFCDYTESPAAPAAVPTAILRPADRSSFDWTAPRPLMPMKPEPLAKTMPTKTLPVSEERRIPYDVQLFISARMSYVHSFHLPANQFELFQKAFQISPENGCVIFMEPRGLGGGYRVFPYEKGREKDTFYCLMELSRDYLRKKSVKYDKVMFVTEAKLLRTQRAKAENLSVEETVRIYEERQVLLKTQYEEKLLSKDERIEQQAGKITRLKNQLEAAKEEVEEIRRQAREKVAQAENRQLAMRSRMEYLESLSRRPKTPQDIPEWAEKRFAGRLELHAKAVKKIQDVAPNSVDMQLLCDALEYLAWEYRDQRAGIISRDEAGRRSSEKYGRPFEISSCGTTSIEMYPRDYKIKYKTGVNGKLVETPLTDHLKVGNTSGNLIRIYFLYDEVKRKIVVGSLPHHLKVAQIQA